MHYKHRLQNFLCFHFRRRLRNAARRAAESAHHDTYMKGQYGGSLGPKDYGKGHETLRYQYPPPGVLNGYPRNRAMEMRPLPEIPDEASAKGVGDTSDVMVRPGEFPNVHAAPFTPGSYYQKPDDGSASRQYFVLDPELNADSDVDDMDLRYVSGNPHKSPEPEIQENFVKNLCPPGTSCNHIPSCFPQHVNMNEYKETGNCSWP